MYANNINKVSKLYKTLQHCGQPQAAPVTSALLQLTKGDIQYQINSLAQLTESCLDGEMIGQKFFNKMTGGKIQKEAVVENTNTSRRYNCETCTTVPPFFLEKCKGSFVQIQGQGDDKEKNRHSDTTENDRTLEILDRIENSVVDAITKTHEKNQDDMIIQLKLDLQNERNHKEHMSEISKKFEEVKGTISTASSEIKSEIKSIMKEGAFPNYLWTVHAYGTCYSLLLLFCNSGRESQSWNVLQNSSATLQSLLIQEILMMTLCAAIQYCEYGNACDKTPQAHKSSCCGSQRKEEGTSYYKTSSHLDTYVKHDYKLGKKEDGGENNVFL
ncbi:unnamed protein product [Mytilus edulis]|uniref:Uncharacterized protein n=1 Tax=Mytilus edulis TaxID=6550 RepID=A0A8S3TXK3_MYTED|nr:unnamed protein product [Mytilus edulis]